MVRLLGQVVIEEAALEARVGACTAERMRVMRLGGWVLR